MRPPSDKIKEPSFFDLVYDAVCRIPKGKVATYGQIASLAGNKRWSRVVGYALHVNPDPEHIPCHRVVNRLGEVSKAFAFGGIDGQKDRLEKDGICVNDYKVDLKKYKMSCISEND